MTLRSPKKRLITALTSTQANRSSDPKSASAVRHRLLALILDIPAKTGSTLLLSAALLFSASSVSAQETRAHQSGWQSNSHFRPATQVHSIGHQSNHATNHSGNAAHANSFAQRPASSYDSTSTTSTRRPGWNLQWRTSPSIAAEQARRVSDAAFAQPQTRVDVWDEAASVATTFGPAKVSLQTVPEPQPVDANQLREARPTSVRQVAWMTQNTAPSGGFSVPDNLFRDGTGTPPPRPESLPPGQPSLGLPRQNGSVVQELPVPRTAPEIPNELSELFETESPPTPQPVPQPSSPAPSTQPKPITPQADSSIRDMIQEEPAPIELRDLPKEMDELESPSDRETFAPNPFGSRTEPRIQDSRSEDRETREDARARRQANEDRPSIFSDDEGPASSGTGLSCEDFRTRIEESTIDKLSLDISPPFRPDVIDESEYQKLRGKFNAKQDVRQWRSIDGRVLGTGRLSDLAYEKAVITTEFDSLEELPLNRLSEPDLAYISQNWGLPTECLIEQVVYTPRNWTPTTMTWTASNLCHKPLYFEEVNLERYGHTAGPFAQPIISSAHFFFNIAVLPYKMGVHSPHECQYALGYYRPGNCAPWIIPPVPLSVKGAWYQAAAITGTALLVP